MYWSGKDLAVFITQQEYVDTALVPLVKLDGSNEGRRQSASATEFLLSLTNTIEQQFKGRIVMMPPTLLTAGMSFVNNSGLIEKELRMAGFQHIFFMTTDLAISKELQQQDVIWLPSIPLESMDAKMKQSILNDQLRQIIPIFSQKWG